MDQVNVANEVPAAMPIPDEVVKQVAGIPRPVALKYTVDGEVVILGVSHPDDPKKMLFRELPLKVVDTPILPASWTKRQDFVMGVVYEACRQIKEAKRDVPLTRSELQQFQVEKGEIDKLVKNGFLNETTIPLKRTAIEGASSKPTQQLVSVVYFTPKGRAYVRKSIDPMYGLPTGSPAADSDRAHQDEGGAGAGSDATTPADSPKL